jgi:hypothetical protein
MRRFLLTLVTLGAVGIGASAQTPVVSFNFSGHTTADASVNGFATYAPGWSTGVAGQTIAMTDINPQVVNNGFGGNSWETTAAPVSATNFFTFSLTNNTGGAVTLGSVSIMGNRTSKGPTDFQIQNSVTGFHDGILTDPTWNFTGGTPTAHTFDLPAGVSVANGASVEFRLFGYNASNPGGSFWLDSGGGGSALSVTPVPEPATVLGAAAGAFAFAGALRRRLRPTSS